MRHCTPFILLFALFHTAQAAGEPFRLAPLFTDNMVLQQRSSVTFWGRGAPGSIVDIRASWKTESRARVGPDGTWSASLRTIAAGGPYTVVIGCGDTMLTLHNCLLGEVWLCSGQSNMEMPLEGWPPDSVLRSRSEIERSSFPRIRLYHVKRAYAARPESVCDGRWEECSPATSAGFSAAAYFFGRKIHQVLRVPVGLIEATWGGTPIEAWTSSASLARMPEFDSTLQKIRLAGESLGVLREWLGKFPSVDVSRKDPGTRWKNIDFRDAGCSDAAYPDSAWREMRLPTLWEETAMGEFDGTVWFRKRVTIPSAWLHRDLRVELGPIDDMDITYVNGHEVGSHESEGFWKLDRSYPVPKEIVDTTAITIAVRVIDYGGGGGIYGSEQSMYIHPEKGDERLSLAGDWRFLPVAEYGGSVFSVFGAQGQEYFNRPVLPLDFSPNTPTGLYNGMIAPLVPFCLAGAIWYQGESNVSRPALYGRLFPLMINDWRGAFRTPGLPFYFVQIAPYEYGPGSMSQFLRESQLAACRLRNTGMAVTLDIGSPANIHPANKQEVGRRLALLALGGVYGRRLVCTGPVVRSVRSFRDRIELTFDHADGGLVVIQSEQGNGFSVAGGDGVFHDAEAMAKGNRLVVFSPDVKSPRSVRYAFTNAPRATLFNGAGFPASSFRTDTGDQ